MAISQEILHFIPDSPKVSSIFQILTRDSTRQNLIIRDRRAAFTRFRPASSLFQIHYLILEKIATIPID